MDMGATVTEAFTTREREGEAMVYPARQLVGPGNVVLLATEDGWEGLTAPPMARPVATTTVDLGLATACFWRAACHAGAVPRGDGMKQRGVAGTEEARGFAVEVAVVAVMCSTGGGRIWPNFHGVGHQPQLLEAY
eukprot:jgi/Undpi1/13546/HiC_scaffold_8.g03205.m1